MLAGWLAKGRGGSGGGHIKPAAQAVRGAIYYQRTVPGIPISALFISDGANAKIIGFSSQWTLPTVDKPYRYGGAAQPATLAPDVAASLTAAVGRLAAAVALVGLNSVDFLVDDKRFWLVDINPRPGATLDIFEFEARQGSLFFLHMSACAGKLLPTPHSDGSAKAAAIVYAENDIGSVPSLAWPHWTADRPRSGSMIKAGEPLCTIYASGSDVTAARALTDERRKLVLAWTLCGTIMTKVPTISINERAAKLVSQLITNATELRIGISRGDLGETVIDAGSENFGGIAAGLRIAEICMGGLGEVGLVPSSSTPRWPWTLVVRSSNPVIACLASQYAGWRLTDDSASTPFMALGSGPARALAQREPLFGVLNYVDSASSSILVIESSRSPPAKVVAKVAQDCRVKPENLTIIFAPTQSLVGCTQIVARVLEVALHKIHELAFPLERVVDGVGAAPLCPPHPDFVTAMGRTNDAIIFAGQVQLYVTGPADEARALAGKLPSNSSRDYGRPFARIFKEVKGDFYAIDPMLFSPAKIIITALETGESFHCGEINLDLLDASFS